MQPKGPSTDEWMKNMWYIYLYIMEYYSATEKEWNTAICNKRMDLENIIPREISQTENDKCYMISLTGGI